MIQLRRLVLMMVVAILPIAGAATRAQAQAGYPSRPITIVVGFEAGGATDLIARLIAKRLGDDLNGTVIVQNLSGAATIRGAERVASSEADGYTLFLTNSTTFATNPSFRRDLKYSLDDFDAITLVSRIPLVLDVNATFPASDVAGFIAYGKGKDGGISIATAGPGSIGDIANGMARGFLQVPVTDVPYRGGGPAITDIRKGVVDAYFDNLSTSVPLIENGTLKGLAIASARRSPFVPNVPTFKELGYPDFVLENVYVLLTRKGTPRPIIDNINRIMRKAFDDDAFKALLLRQGVLPESSTPEEAVAAVRQDYETSKRAVEKFGLKKID